jgi:late competence protein required for DNA uptake (superfamily II DNA/RNA helicase)
MRSPNHQLVQGLVSEEIRRIVADAIQGRGTCLRAARCASLIARAFPNCGLTADQIANEIIEAAIHAGINVEISKPRHDVVREPAGTMHSR